MEIWIQETWLPYFIPLGWALFHSTWQSLLVFVTWKIIQEISPKMSPKFRYGLGLSSLALIFLLFWAGVYKEYSVKEKPIWVHSEKISRPLKLSNLPYVGIQKTESLVHFWESKSLELGFSVLGFIYILCLVWMGIRLSQSLVQIHFLRNPKNLYEPEKSLIDLYEKLKKRIPFPTEAKLWLSQAINSPITFGYLKPIILFPLGICSKLSISQMEGLLIHEMAHIIRKDYLFNFLQGLVETFLFFNPLVWILSHEIRSEREKCCDDWVTNYYSDSSMIYAQTLLHLEEERQLNFKLSISALGQKNELLNRIQRIMKNNETTPRYPLFTGLIFLFIGISLIGFLSSGTFLSKSKIMSPSSLKKNSKRFPDTLKHPLKVDSNTHGDLKELENKKLKEILDLEMTEKRVEMDSMSQIMNLKSSEIGKLNELLALNGKEMGELFNRRKKKFISESDYNDLMTEKYKNLDSLYKIMALKQMELSQYRSTLSLKNKEMDSIHQLMNIKGSIRNNPDKTFTYIFKAPHYSYQYTLPPMDSDGEENAISNSRKLNRIQRKLNKLNEKDLNKILSQSLKDQIHPEIKIDKKKMESEINNSLKFAFAQDENLKEPKLNIEVPEMDEIKIRKEIEENVKKNLVNIKNLKFTLKNDLEIKSNIESDLNEKIQNEVENSKKYTLDLIQKLETEFNQNEIEKVKKQLEKNWDPSKNAELNESIKKAHKEIEKAKEELRKLKTLNPPNPPNFNLQFDFKIDSLESKDPIRIRKDKLKIKRQDSPEKDPENN